MKLYGLSLLAACGLVLLVGLLFGLLFHDHDVGGVLCVLAIVCSQMFSLKPLSQIKPWWGPMLAFLLPIDIAVFFEDGPTVGAIMSVALFAFAWFLRVAAAWDRSDKNAKA